MTARGLARSRRSGHASWLPAVLLAALGGCTDTGSGPSPAVAVPAPAGVGSLAPRLSRGADGGAVLSWLEPDEDLHVLRYAVWQDGAWGPARGVARGGDWFVSDVDVPAVVPITAEIWAAHWLVSSPAGFFAYDIAYSLSVDGGRSFEAPRLLNDDGTATEHGFVSWFEWNGAAGVVWLDGRNLAAEPSDDAAADPLGTSLRFARIAADGRKLAEGVVDELACDCCSTDVAVSGGGPIVVYRDRTPAERRDVVARALRNGGFGAAVELGPDDWIIEGCPVNGPAVDAAGSDVVAAWFTAPDNQARVRVARSGDGGTSFAPAIDVDGAAAFGHVGVALHGDGRAIVSWWRGANEGGTELVAQAVARDGTLGERRVVTTVGVARPTDLPQVLSVADRLIFAWTDATQSAIRTAYVDWR